MLKIINREIFTSMTILFLIALYIQSNNMAGMITERFQPTLKLVNLCRGFIKGWSRRANGFGTRESLCKALKIF